MHCSKTEKHESEVLIQRKPYRCQITLSSLPNEKGKDSKESFDQGHLGHVLLNLGLLASLGEDPGVE